MSSTQQQSSSPAPLAFFESVALPLTLEPDMSRNAMGGYMSVEWGALKSPIDVSSVAFVSDPGLEVTYVGYSRCARGCPGTSLDAPSDTQFALQSIDGKLPAPASVAFSSGPAYKVILHLHLTPVGVSHVMRGCLYSRSANVQILGVGSAEVSSMTSAHYIAAVELTNPPSNAPYARCHG